jgi:hypothetical protein
MKTLRAIYFLLAVLLAFSLFVGCDNGTTNGNYDFIDVPVNPPFEYIPVDPIAPPYANIPTLDNYDAIFMGEDHSNRENFGVYLNTMKYYYSPGIRDFAFEDGYSNILLLQYYLENGNEECLELYFSFLKQATNAYVQERYDFYKDVYIWNSTLRQKIRLHGFDVEHQYSRGAPEAAIYLYILRKYSKIEGIPGLSTPGTIAELIDDFKNNRARYSSLSVDDMKVFERIIAYAEQGMNFYANGGATLSGEMVREPYMINNFRQILNETGGRKIFAIMGWIHADQKGTDTGGPPVGFTMASRLKNEIRIASVVLRQQVDTDRFQYNIPINENLKTTPYNSTYDGDWPFQPGSGYSGHLPSITLLVAGITGDDYNNGIPEKTVFNMGYRFIYYFRASDSKGDWKQMVHTMSRGEDKYNYPWNFTDRFLGHANIETVEGYYTLGSPGTWQMEWYILDAAGNKSNVITRTITVN